MSKLEKTLLCLLQVNYRVSHSIGNFINYMQTEIINNSHGCAWSRLKLAENSVEVAKLSLEISWHPTPLARTVFNLVCQSLLLRML